MGSLGADSEVKVEMDDSGCVQDDPQTLKDEVQRVNLLDLSDDVLLLIMMNLCPRDLKALGYCCERLGALVLDRTLWVVADAREYPVSEARLRWLLHHALHPGTKELLLTGCVGETDQWLAETQEKAREEKENGKERADSQASESNNIAAYAHRSKPPTWPELEKWPPADSPCPPHLTITGELLRRLRAVCPALTCLALEYCNINCHTININQFPPTLKKLSLRGSRCYNHPLNRSFLFKIQDYLPNLETLDVCSCDWMEPASFLPLSKLPCLKHLYMRNCHRLTEFVAYASLATRYGFLKLQTLDLRGSPVGDSEVSALGWLGSLRRLWLSPAKAGPPAGAGRPERAPWEHEEPEYYKNKPPRYFDKDTNGAHSGEEDDDKDKPAKRKASNDAGPSNGDDPGPSKRKRDDNDTTSGAGTSRDQDAEREGLPKHHVLYVNVGQQEPTSQVHAVYRLSLDTDHLFCRNPYLRQPEANQVFLTPAPHLDADSLVTDSAIRRFGRADGEDINYVHIGPNGPEDSPLLGHRPNRSHITHLSITGFRYITDRSLVHLATAAPDLVFIDFSETNVTAQGVETFKSLRPECEVIFSPYVEKKD